MNNEKDAPNYRVRSIHNTDFKTREENGEMFIEGYFAVFNSIYELWSGATEEIAPGAFSDTLGDDIRALINHDSTLVLGRNRAGTLELREDSVGLWGRIRVNPNDTDAVNCYERVKRGDVSQCSIGFDILSENTDVNGNDVHWTILAVKLYEVSVCTFPAYEETSIAARQCDFSTVKKRRFDEWKTRTLQKLKGEANGTENIDA